MSLIFRDVSPGLAPRLRVSTLGRDHLLADGLTLGDVACKSGADEVLWHPLCTTIIQRLRARFGNIILTSCYRTLHYNRVTLRERGYRTAWDSWHMHGYAFDVVVPGVSPREVYDWLAREINPGGLILYAGHVHVDIGAGRLNRDASDHDEPEPGDNVGPDPVVGPPIMPTLGERATAILPPGTLPAWITTPDAPRGRIPPEVLYGVGGLAAATAAAALYTEYAERRDRR